VTFEQAQAIVDERAVRLRLSLDEYLMPLEGDSEEVRYAIATVLVARSKL
jgi:hypothetical protein